MIIVRSPLRITLGGGGTDLPSFYRDHEGLLIAAAIDKYVYITLHETFMPELIVKYSQMERTKTVDEVKHPLVREALKVVGITKPSIEITSMADIPAGTGLGSSGSFTTALLKRAADQMIPLLHPYFEMEGGEMHHRARYGRYPLMALIVGPDPATDAEDLALTEQMWARTARNMKSTGAGSAA